MEKKDLVEQLAEELDDFELASDKATYEISLIYFTESNDNDSITIDSGYEDLNEARKCFEHFSDEDNVMNFLEMTGQELPNDTMHVRVLLLMQLEAEDMTEIIEENEIF